MYCKLQIYKTVNVRHRMDNHITACRYETSTDKFSDHVFNY